MRERRAGMSMKALTWNVEWATPRARRTAEILRRIDHHAPEVVCLTETHAGLMGQHGHTICSQADAGYGANEHRRKVMLWSSKPWTNVDDLGVDSMPPGRFVSGVTRTSLGEIMVIGVCIPWFGSRTEARRNLERRRRWEDHEQYLADLAEFLRGGPVKTCMVMGDFNQAIGPGSRAPLFLQLALQDAFSPNVSIVTSELEFQGRRSIDHIALSDELTVDSLAIVSNMHDGKRLTDHFGVAVEVSGGQR